MPYWQLRDHQHSAPARCANGSTTITTVRQAALLHPTSGDHLLSQELRAQGKDTLPHTIRVALDDLQLHPAQPRRTRKPTVEVSRSQDWPPGRRVQQGAPRLSLPDGVCWIDFVLDVISRVTLASRVVQSLSMHLAGGDAARGRGRAAGSGAPRADPGAV